MTTETILTDDQIERLADINDHNSFTLRAHNDMKLARAIEQAVLQSPEIQAMRKDAERYRWLRDRCDETALGGLTICEVGTFELEPWSGDDPDFHIDAAMEQQT